MNILIINGSPKGDNSCTLYTSLYLEKKHPEHSFYILNAASAIRSIEKDFSVAKALLEKAELIIFSYPVYTFLVPSQLHRFIELMKESGVDFHRKNATQITTSMHFYDVTAHKFIEENCVDCGMRFYEGLSAGMEDILSEKGRSQAEAFFNHLINSIENVDNIEDMAGRKIVVLTDARENDILLKRMIFAFQKNIKCDCDVVNLLDFSFRGGCLGCLRCAPDGKCVYNDGFDDFLRERIQKSDAIVTAFTVKDHSMGYLFKLYDDRQFCNGHRTVTAGKPVGYIVNGSLENEHNLKMMLEARADVGGNYLAGFACDEKTAETLANEISYAIKNNYLVPQRFYGVGGMKIFRDLIWIMQGFMSADHKFYKENGLYDFPQKSRGKMLKMRLLGLLINNKKIRAKIGEQVQEGMIGPYKKMLEEN